MATKKPQRRRTTEERQRNMQLCSKCGKYCRRALNICPTCYPPVSSKPARPLS